MISQELYKACIAVSIMPMVAPYFGGILDGYYGLALRKFLLKSRLAWLSQITAVASKE